MAVKKTVNFFSEGNKLSGIIYFPEQKAPQDKPYPGVVFCHGYGATKDFIAPDIAERLSKNGYITLIFDYRGFGESEGERWRLIPEEQVLDIQNAMIFLSLQEGVDPQRLGLYGTSFGGGNAVYASALTPSVKCTVVVGGFGDGERWMQSIRRYWEWLEFRRRVEADRKRRVLTGQSERVEPDEILVRDPEALEYNKQLLATYPQRRFTLPLESAEAIIAFKPEEVVQKIAPRPVLFIHCEDDVLVPKEQALGLFAKAEEPKKLFLLPGVQHHGVYSGKPFEIVLSQAIAWFNQYL